MTLPVVVIGAGGHARVLVDCLRLSGRKILGVVTNDGKMDTLFEECPILGDDVAIEKYSPNAIELVNGVGVIAITPLRARIYSTFKNKGYQFATVIHPAAVVASSVVLHEGVQVMAGAIIQPGTVIGVNSIINTRASVDHDCQLGGHVHVAPGSTLSGGIRVGDGTLIGTGSSIIQGITIGCEVLVAAGAVVTTNLPSKVTVRGVPAKQYTYEVSEICASDASCSAKGVV